MKTFKTIVGCALTAAMCVFAIAAQADVAYIDVMFALDKKAVTYLNDEKEGTTPAQYMSARLAEMNQVLVNSGLDDKFQFRSAGVYELGFEAKLVDSSKELTRDVLENATGGKGMWEDLHIERDNRGADVVSVIIDTGSEYGHVGDGNALTSIADASTFGKNAYSVVGVRSTFDYYAILHEIAHNMGAGHASEVGAGSHVTDYAYGYYFAGNTKSYYTIMGYPKTGYSPAPIFSTPDETYDGVAAGTSTKDNVRVLEQTFLAASQWRSLPAKAHPAMSVSWNQSSPMNDFAAMAQKDGSWEKAPCGCPATAAAQMLKHYVWPMRTDSSFTGATQRYIDSTPQSFPIRFDGHNDFQWAKMQDHASDNDVVGNFETARLTMWCGAMGGTDYRVGDSSAQFDDIAESASELFQKGKSTYFFSDGAEAVWKAITNALDRGELVQVTLKGHQVVADDYRLTSGDLEVHLNYGWAGSQTGWYTRTQLSDQYSGILYVWTGFAPKKMAQVKPLAKQVASTGTIPLSWALPQMYANDLTGFMIMAYYPGDSVVNSYAGDTGTIAADRAGTYTLTGVYKLTNESSLSCTLSSYHTSGIKAELQARYDAGEWTTIATPELSTEEDEYNKGVLVKSGWLATPIAVDLSSHAGETAEFRFKISRTAKTRTKDGQIFFSKPTWAKVYQPASQQLGLQGYPDLRSYPLSASGYAGKVVSFTIEPIMSDSVVGEPVATKVVTTAVPDLPAIVSIDSLSSSMTNGFQRTCGIGKSVFFVKANATTTAVTAAPSHLALVPDSNVSCEKVNGDTWAVMIDAEDTPVNSQMILTLIAQDALGNKSYKDLQLTFRSGEGGAEPEDSLVTALTSGSYLYLAKGESQALDYSTEARTLIGRGTVSFTGGVPETSCGLNDWGVWRGRANFTIENPTQEQSGFIAYQAQQNTMASFYLNGVKIGEGPDPEPEADPNEMYHNTLSAGNEDIKVARGTYGTIEVPVNGYYATAFDELTTLSTTASASIGGSYTNIIKDGTYIATHTVVGWFKVGALPTGSNLATLYLAKSCNNSDNGYKVAVDASGKILVGKINYDSGNYSWNGSNYKTTDAAVVAADTWFHLAIALTKTTNEKSVTPAVFVNGEAKSIASGTFAGNLNGNSCTDLMVGAGVTASGVYVDTTALSDAAKVASFATNAYYVVKGAQPMPEPTEPLSQMYFNRLSTGSTFVTPGAHGSITVPGDGYCATAYSSATVLDNSASDPERGGAYTSVIVTSPDCNVNTHTVAGWFKIDTMPTGNNKQILWSCQNSSGDYRGYAVAVNASGELGISRTTNASLDFENNNNFSSGAGIQAGVWYHIAFSIKQNGTADPNRNAEVQLFVNGEDKGSLTSSNKLKIGCNGGAACSSFTIAAGVSAAGVYVDTQAFTKAATIKSLATNSTYLKPYVPEPTNAAKIGDTEYATVAAAIEAVTTGQTITLLKNVEENLASGAKTFTLALDGHTLNGTLDIAVAGVITLDLGSGTLSSTLTGGGKIIYDGHGTATALPTSPTGVTANTWTGTVCLRGYLGDATGMAFEPNSLGNANSTVEANGVRCWLKANGDTFNGTLVLEDYESASALILTNAATANCTYTISKLKGSGELVGAWYAGGTAKSAYLYLPNISEFTGSLASRKPGACKYGFMIGATSGATAGKITLASGATATIASGKFWEAEDGIVINGAIGGAGTLASATTFGDGAEIDTRNGTLTANGALTFGASTKVRVAAVSAGDIQIINKSGTTAGEIDTTVSVYVGSSATAESGNYKLSYKDDGVYLVAGESPYAKFDYGTVYSWVTTGSGTIEFAGDSSDLQVFDIVGGTNKTDTTYHGTTTFSSVSGGKFWHQFAYASATPMSEIYAAPGEIWRFEQGTYCNSVAAGYGPLTIGGMIVEPGATAFTFVNTESKTRTTLLGDPTATTPTFFDIGANLTFNRHGIFYLAGTLTFDIAGNTTNDLNSAQSSFDLALVNTVVSGASGAFGATTPGGTLVMKGAGTLKVATLKALGSTLDYSNQPYNRVTPYIAGTLQMDANTMIVLPAGLPESTAFKMATTLTGVEAGPVRRIIRLGNGEPAIKSVTFDTAAGTISYADDPSVFTATLTNTGYLNFQAITWDGGKTWTGGSADAYVELHIEGDGELILSLNGNVTAGTIRAVSSSANAQLKINNTGSTTLSVGTFDFSDAVGKTTLNYATGTANVVAGLDTVLTSAGSDSGSITVGSGKKATVPAWYFDHRTVSAGGYLKFTGDLGSKTLATSGGIPSAGATVEIAGTAEIAANSEFAAGTANTKIKVTGAVTTASGNAEIKLANNANSIFEVADGTLTLQNRVRIQQNTTGKMILSGGEITASGDGFLYPGGGYGGGSMDFTITGGKFTAGYNALRTQLGCNATVNISGGIFEPANLWTVSATGTSAGKKPTEDDTAISRSGSNFAVNMTGGTFNVPAGVPNWLPINVTSGEATIGVQTGVVDPVVRSVITVSGGKLNLPAGLASTNVTLSAGATLNVITNTPGQAAYSITTGTFANNGTVQLNGVNLPTADYEVSGNQIVKKSGPTPTNTAKIGDTEYATLAAALAAVQSGETITLLKNCDEAIATTNTFTFVPAGFTYGGVVTVNQGGVLTIDGGDSCTIASAVTIANGGKLITKGTLSLPNSGNVANNGSALEVATGTLTYECGEKKLSANIVIRKDATYVQGTTVRTNDQFDFANAHTVDVYGTLNLAGSRWSVKNNTTINLYPGALISGNGESTYGAIDAADTTVLINVKKNGETGGTATISARLRPRGNPGFAYNVEEDMTLVLNGTLGDKANGFRKEGAGTLLISTAYATTGRNTFAGGTVKIGNAGALGTSIATNLFAGATLDLNGQTLTDKVAIGNGKITNTSDTTASYNGIPVAKDVEYDIEGGAIAITVAAEQTYTLSAIPAANVVKFHGAGTVVYDNATVPTLPTGIWADDWTGTFKYTGFSGTKTAWDLRSYYNGTLSKFEFAGTMTDGYFYNGAFSVGELVLSGSIKFTNGFTGSPVNNYVFTKLSGSGTFEIATTTTASPGVKFCDVSGFTGIIKNTGNGASGYRVLLGDGDLLAVGDYPAKAAIHFTGNATLQNLTLQAGNGINVTNDAVVTIASTRTATFSSATAFAAGSSLVLGDKDSKLAVGAAVTVAEGVTIPVKLTDAADLTAGKELITWTGTVPAGDFSFSVASGVSAGDKGFKATKGSTALTVAEDNTTTYYEVGGEGKRQPSVFEDKWLTDAKITGSTEQVQNKLDKKNAYDIKASDAYLMGYKATEVETAAVVLASQQTSLSDKVRLVIQGVPDVSARRNGAVVTYTVKSSTSPTMTGAETRDIGESTIVDMTLPTEGVLYYRVEATIDASGTKSEPIPAVVPSSVKVAAGMPVKTGVAGAQVAAALGTTTVTEATESITFELGGAGVYEGQEYHLSVDEKGSANANAVYGLVAKATKDKTVTFDFGHAVAVNTECALTMISAAGNGNVVVKSPTVSTGANTEDVIVSTRVGWLPYNDGLATMTAPAMPQQFRIPAIATDGKGEVIACYDCRYGKSDLGATWNSENGDGNVYSGIDIAENYSSDNGRTFGSPTLGVDVPNMRDQTGAWIGGYANRCNWSYIDKTRDLGDVCLLYDPNGDGGKGLYWMMGLTGGGLTTDSSKADVVLYTRKPGKDSPWVEWNNNKGSSDPLEYRSVKQQILDSLGTTSSTIHKGFLQGPGHGIVTTHDKKVNNETAPAGTLVFPIQCFFTGGTRSGAAYSTDHGATWKATPLCAVGNDSQENCIMELDDGTWYMCCKCNGNGLYRCYIFDHENNAWVNLNDGAPCTLAREGSCLRLGVGADGKGRYAICHARYDRSNIVVYFGTDTTSSSDPTEKAKGISWDWTKYITIHKENTNGGYSSMCMVDDTTLGILYETNYGASTDGGTDTSGCRMYFTRIDVSDKVVPPTPEK